MTQLRFGLRSIFFASALLLALRVLPGSLEHFMSARSTLNVAAVAFLSLLAVLATEARS